MWFTEREPAFTITQYISTLFVCIANCNVMQNEANFTATEKSVSMITVSAAATEASICIDAVSVRTTSTVVMCTFVNILAYKFNNITIILQLLCSTYEDEIWRQSFLCGRASRVEQFASGSSSRGQSF